MFNNRHSAQTWLSITATPYAIFGIPPSTSIGPFGVWISFSSLSFLDYAYVVGQRGKSAELQETIELEV